jgi:hypothetical protein
MKLQTWVAIITPFEISNEQFHTKIQSYDRELQRWRCKNIQVA